MSTRSKKPIYRFHHPLPTYIFCNYSDKLTKRFSCNYFWWLRKLRKGNVFTSVSRILSGGRCTPPRQTPPGQTPPLGRHPPGQTHPLGRYPPSDAHCSGVRILLECNLVFKYVAFNRIFFLCLFAQETGK